MLAGSSNASESVRRPSATDFAAKSTPDNGFRDGDENVEVLAHQLGTVLTSTFGAVNRKFTAIEKKSDLLSNELDEFEKQKESIKALHKDVDVLRSSVNETLQLIKRLETRVDSSQPHKLDSTKTPSLSHTVEHETAPAIFIEKIAKIEADVEKQIKENEFLREKITELEVSLQTAKSEREALEKFVEENMQQKIDEVHTSCTSQSEKNIVPNERILKLEETINDIRAIVDSIESTKAEEKTRRDELAAQLETLQNNMSTVSGVSSQFNELTELVGDLREAVKSSLGFSASIKRLQLNMNDVIADIDELKYKHSQPQSSMSAQHGSHGIVDVANFKNSIIEGEIEGLRLKLLELRDDLDAGLDAFADAHAGDPEGSEALDSPFIAKVAELADHLDTVIPATKIKETIDATITALFGPLDTLTIEMEKLFEMDKAATAAMGITFDDLNIEGNKMKKSARDNLMKLYQMSLPILDYRIDKITMRRRLEKIEASIDMKADTTAMVAMEQQLRHLVNAKADQSELHSIASKKVSLGELQRLKDQLMKQIVSLKGSEHDNAGEGYDSVSAALVNEKTTGLADELKKLTRRFDILHNLQEDLIAQCEKLVPREEVEQALRALLNELKMIKNNSVTSDALKESLKSKANAAEVQKLITALTGALGDLLGKTDVASAAHLRCLVCDKPVRSLVLDPISTARKRDVSPEKLGQPFGGGFYSKVHDKVSQSIMSMDSHASPNTHSSDILNSQSLLSSWASPQRGSQMSANARPETLTLSAGNDFKDLTITDSPTPGAMKVSSDFAIMRSSVDLPPIDHQSSGKASANALKQRVRVSAGGGLGPTYTLDTR